jgi:Malectin domain
MQFKKYFLLSCGLFIFALSTFLLAGCQSSQNQSAEKTAASAMVPSAAPVAPVVAAPAAERVAAVPEVPPPVHIKAGSTDSFKDSEDNAWLPDQGFADGETVERADLEIANTKTPAIYRSERYSMTSFSYPVPNGKYIVKLHFCETYDGITGPGQRVFSFNVEGQDFKDFDVWAKAGGPLRAYVQTVNVEVTDGKLDISFTPNIENPQINGIEILPAP